VAKTLSASAAGADSYQRRQTARGPSEKATPRIRSSERVFRGRTSRRYWVWVSGPSYYLDDNGEERRDLDPAHGYEPGGWWTCNRKTEEGDLVLVYRSQLKKDLGYLIETRSAAYSILDEDLAAEKGWDYGCDYEVIEKFKRPLTLGEMRSDPALQDWGPLRANFRRRVYEIQPDIWNHLLDRLVPDRRKVDRRRQTVANRYALERDIEDRLAADLSAFRRYGYKLELVQRQHICRRGGRADIVAFDVDAKRYVVIELKRGLVSRNAIAQLLSYRASIVDEFPARRPPIGLLVGERLDNEAQGMIDDDQRLDFVALSDLFPP
jgi:predicted RNA-binding protein with PUA-like domain